MKYVVAEMGFMKWQTPTRVIMADHEWERAKHLRGQFGYVVLFESDTVAEAEALVALLPDTYTLTGVNK